MENSHKTTVELVPAGSEVMVTYDNRQEFVRRLITQHPNPHIRLVLELCFRASSSRTTHQDSPENRASSRSSTSFPAGSPTCVSTRSPRSARRSAGGCCAPAFRRRCSACGRCRSSSWRSAVSVSLSVVVERCRALERVTARPAIGTARRRMVMQDADAAWVVVAGRPEVGIEEWKKQTSFESDGALPGHPPRAPPKGSPQINLRVWAKAGVLTWRSG